MAKVGDAFFMLSSFYLISYLAEGPTFKSERGSLLSVFDGNAMRCSFLFAAASFLGKRRLFFR